MNYTVNVTDIEQALINLGGEGNTRSIQDRILTDHCQNIVPENYSYERSFRQTIQRKIEDYCPQAEGFDQAKKEAKFLRVGHGLYRLAAGYQHREFTAIEEVSAEEEYPEGATKTITVNSYERNPKARAACIAHYGLKCIACGFDFAHVYGEIGKAFIHVHHVVPLSQTKVAYKVDPINDLRPVCANCHAIIHRSTPALSISDVIDALNAHHEFIQTG
jgi:5-methylcytosine-specific restriction protein A